MDDIREICVQAHAKGVSRQYLLSKYADTHGLTYGQLKWWIEAATKKQKANAEFDAIIADLESPILGDKEPEIGLEEPLSTVLVIPDLHCPFEHPDALDFLQAVAVQYNTDAVVNLGDEIDAHALGRWPKDPDGMNAGAETQAAIEHLKPFYRAFPEVKVCTSNHTVRPWKKAYEEGIPATFLRSVETVLNAPDGWVWADEHMIDNVLYFHGEGKSGQNAHLAFLRARKRSVVHGHIHSYGGVATEGEHFAMNAGCLIDHEAYAFAYGKKHPIKVSLGCGVVFEGRHALFIRMDTDHHGRWTGKIF